MISVIYILPRVISAMIVHWEADMITLIVALVALAALYLYGTRTYGYWKERGVKHDRPVPFFGTNARNYLRQKSVCELSVELYNKYPKEKIVGFYRGPIPELYIRDPEIVKRIIMTDFMNFYPKGINMHKKVIEPLLRNLFFADGDLWRLLRQRMTPAFTSGKLKAMFPLIVERAERLQDRLRTTIVPGGTTVEARDLMARYTTDFIGACGFGIDADSLNQEDSSFRQLGIKIFKIDPMKSLIVLLKQSMPETFKHLKIFHAVENELIGLVRQILKQRNYEPSNRNDFIDLLLELRKKGVMEGNSIENFRADGTPERVELLLSDELIAAQVFIFFAAGFETSSSATSFTLHQLAFHPEVQKKVQENIDTVLAKYDNKLCYEAVKEMHYLEWAFKEGMRMFPSLGVLLRQCARKYTIPELGVTLDEGVRIVIPIEALQNDPQYFDNPQEFRPERFDPQVFDANRYKYIYLPFGEGPRACIGERLGLMQSLAGLAAILSRFSVAPAPASVRRPVVDPTANITQSLRGGLPLLFTERTKA